MDLLHQKIAGRNELPGWSSPGGVRIVDPDASAVGVESLSQIVSVAEIIIDECGLKVSHPLIVIGSLFDPGDTPVEILPCGVTEAVVVPAVPFVAPLRIEDAVVVEEGGAAIGEVTQVDGFTADGIDAFPIGVVGERAVIGELEEGNLLVEEIKVAEGFIQPHVRASAVDRPPHQIGPVKTREGKLLGPLRPAGPEVVVLHLREFFPAGGGFGPAGGFRLAVQVDLLADAGFGAFSSGLAGYSSAENSLFTGEGNFGTRLLGNILLALPCSLCLWGLFFVARKSFKKEGAKKALSGLLSVLLTGCCVFYVFTMNLRAKPNTERLWEGHDDYLSHVDKTATADSPNVLFILMDDLGWGDVSLNGAIYDTPNIDSIGENGLNFENFYSSYSVCSPARFAAMTGRFALSKIPFSRPAIAHIPFSVVVFHGDPSPPVSRILANV